MLLLATLRYVVSCAQRSKNLERYLLYIYHERLEAILLLGFSRTSKSLSQKMGKRKVLSRLRDSQGKICDSNAYVDAYEFKTKYKTES